jgi:hypothetical protein
MADIGVGFSSRLRTRRGRSGAPPHNKVVVRRQRAAVAIAAGSLLLLASATWGHAQGSAAQEAPAPKPARPTAAEVFQRAIAKQGFPKVADPAADLPLALHAKVGLQFRDDRGNDVSLDAERRFLAPNLIVTKTVDRFSRKEVFTGFDGKKPWFFSEDSGLIDLTGPDKANDLKQLSLDVEMTSTLARAFLLRRLQRELKEPHLIDDVTYVDPRTKVSMTAWVVEGGSEVDIAGQKKKAVLRLFVEQKQARLMGARVMIEGDPPLQLCFTKHETVGGVDLPRKIEIYRNDPKTPEVDAKTPQCTISVEELELAPKLTPADFKPPK